MAKVIGPRADVSKNTEAPGTGSFERLTTRSFRTTPRWRVILIGSALNSSSTVVAAKPLASAGTEFLPGLHPASVNMPSKPEVVSRRPVEEVVLGEKKIGDTISLPDFRLYTVPMFGPERVEPITPETRVLLFLKSSEKVPDTFEVMHDGECFFWVQGAAKVGDLRHQAGDAVKLRRLWGQARGIHDEKKRVEALWPYFMGGTRALACSRRCPAEGASQLHRQPSVAHFRCTIAARRRNEQARCVRSPKTGSKFSGQDTSTNVRVIRPSAALQRKKPFSLEPS
jgi:hypothetical protein